MPSRCSWCVVGSCCTSSCQVQPVGGDGAAVERAELVANVELIRALPFPVGVVPERVVLCGRDVVAADGNIDDGVFVYPECSIDLRAIGAAWQAQFHARVGGEYS